MSGGLKSVTEEEGPGVPADNSYFAFTDDSLSGDGGDAGRRYAVVGMSISGAGGPSTSWSIWNDVRFRRGETEAACARARNCSIFRASFDCPKGKSARSSIYLWAWHLVPVLQREETDTGLQVSTRDSQ